MLDIGPASLKSLIFIELAWSNLTIRLAVRSSLLGRRAIASLREGLRVSLFPTPWSALTRTLTTIWCHYGAKGGMSDNPGDVA